MSHRDDCPDRWEARREGERAGERGYGFNPYDLHSDRPCEEAEREWRRGYYAGEEQRAEEAAHERQVHRQAEERREEERQQQDQYEQFAHEAQLADEEPTR